MTFLSQNGQEFTGHGMYAALSFDQGTTWPVRKLLTPGNGDFDGGAWTRKFTATPTRAEHAGYLAATQTPNNVIHLISSRLHYRLNLAWLTAGTAVAFVGETCPAAPLTMYRSRHEGLTCRPQKPSIHSSHCGYMLSMHMNEHGMTLRRGQEKGCRCAQCATARTGITIRNGNLSTPTGTTVASTGAQVIHSEKPNQ